MPPRPNLTAGWFGCVCLFSGFLFLGGEVEAVVCCNELVNFMHLHYTDILKNIVGKYSMYC